MEDPNNEVLAKSGKSLQHVEYNSIEDIDDMECLVHSEKVIESLDISDNFNCLIGKVFRNLDDAYEFYNHHARSRGFGIRIHYANRNKVTNEIYRRQFVCNKQGFKDMNDKRRIENNVKSRGETQTGCKAMIQLTLSKHGEWIVDEFYDEHNHLLDTPSKVIKQRSHNKFHRSDTCRSIISTLTREGLKNFEIAKVVNICKGNEEADITRVQCSGIVSAERKVKLGKACYEIIKHFRGKADLDDTFYFKDDLGPDGRLKRVFWADGRSRASYNQFGDVVVFDVTYKTNKFSLPFAPFVGVNHHRQSILFGAALLNDETEATFIWLFEQFLKCMFNDRYHY